MKKIIIPILAGTIVCAFVGGAYLYSQNSPLRQAPAVAKAMADKQGRLLRQALAFSQAQQNLLDAYQSIQNSLKVLTNYQELIEGVREMPPEEVIRNKQDLKTILAKYEEIKKGATYEPFETDVLNFLIEGIKMMQSVFNEVHPEEQTAAEMP